VSTAIGSSTIAATTIAPAAATAVAAAAIATSTTVASAAVAAVAASAIAVAAAITAAATITAAPRLWSGLGRSDDALLPEAKSGCTRTLLPDRRADRAVAKGRPSSRGGVLPGYGQLGHHVYWRGLPSRRRLVPG